MEINTFSQDVRALAKADDKKAGGPMGQQVRELAHARNAARVAEPATVTPEDELNASILQSAIDVNISAGNEPLSLLFKTALEGINQELSGVLGDDAIQSAHESGLDVTPEATADRIVSLSTAFFGQYLEANPELSEEEALTSFVQVIQSGVERGFSEAREILGGLNVLSGEIAANVDSTYALVQEGLQFFSESYGQADEAEALL